MWLLNTRTLALKEFFGSNIPPYAILSHTWMPSELLFHEAHELGELTPDAQLLYVREPPQDSRAMRYYLPDDDVPQAIQEWRKPRFKVVNFCKMAREAGFEWAWQDSLCIDKRSSAELTEAINSMHSWYRDAQICIIYLSDVGKFPEKTDLSHGEQDDAYDERVKEWNKTFENSRWFTRGWTLQELVSPKKRIWVANDWTVICNEDDEVFQYSNSCNSKEDICLGHKSSMIRKVSEITKIDGVVLWDRDQSQTFPISERMSWASRRLTTRPEDHAYSLMGLFGVHIPVLYGEGLEAAFRRLQLEIMKTSFDQTIFAWSGRYPNSGLLARRPADFVNTPSNLKPWWPSLLSPFAMTNIGLQLRCVVKIPNADDPMFVCAAIQCEFQSNGRWATLGIPLRTVEGVSCWINGVYCKAYRRYACHILEELYDLEGCPVQDLLILDDSQVEMAISSMRNHDRDPGRYHRFEAEVPVNISRTIHK